MPLTVEACPDATLTAPGSCTQPLVLVDVSAAVPFTLSSAHLANMGQCFAAGTFLVVAFWGLGYGAGLIMRAIKS